MSEAEVDQWQPMASAPRDGTRVLVVIRASEQGPAEVDVARWGRPEPLAEACWVSSDSNHDCVIAYAEAELAYWMPLPSSLPKLRSSYRAFAPELPKDADEMGGSGI
ncbi:MAG: hypothetical protein JOY94_18020 [Methylobacteriaceae bacterium]|nr:hypothetical protein [Methylobacteriaceae bacterium]